jgi:hypothetical protein
MSGFLYLAIVVGWAFYLVPFALRRYDDAARNRPVDKFSSTMRVLGRTGDGAAADDATDSRADASDVESSPEQPKGRPGQRPPVSPDALRAAARTAARRRRRVLLLLLLGTAGTATAAYFVYVPWWSVSVPATLVTAWLVSCRVQARREYGARARRDLTAHMRAVGRSPAAPATDGDRPVEVRDDAVEVAEPPAPESEQPLQPDAGALVAGPAEAGVPHLPAPATGSLWDPVPVTLPTYVHKPRAPRTIRTIDLTAAGVQSSGRAEEGDGDGRRQDAATPARAVGQ